MYDALCELLYIVAQDELAQDLPEGVALVDAVGVHDALAFAGEPCVFAQHAVHGVVASAAGAHEALVHEAQDLLLDHGVCEGIGLEAVQ